MDQERQLKSIEHNIEKEKAKNPTKWNVDQLFPIRKSIHISSDNMFNDQLEQQKKNTKIYGPATGYIRKVLKGAEKKRPSLYSLSGANNSEKV